MKSAKTSRDVFEQAVALEKSGRVDDAAALYRKVISRNGRHDRALFRLSVILIQAGLTAEACRYLERAVEVRRDELDYLTNLGEAYRRLGKLELAGTVLTYALKLEPEHPDARQNLALVQLELGALDDAIRNLERVVALRPENALPYVSLAWALLKAQRPVEARARAERALELAPDLAAAHRCAGDAHDVLGDKVRSLAAYRAALEHAPSDHVTHSNLIVTMLTDPRSTPASVLAESRAWAKAHAEPLRKHVRSHDNGKDPERRLRIGYVSPDFRQHPVRQFFVRLLENHDPAAFDVFLYSSVERPDAVTEWYRTFAGDRFRDILRLADADAAELVRHDGIDVLVDLALHGPGNRLRIFACKPAPVQLTWLGIAGTTGLDTVDYRITDPHFDPPGTDTGVYSETSLHLPETFWAYDAFEPELAMLAVAPLPALERGYVTFGCLNSPRKLHAGALTLWARVLQAVPRSRLLLYVEEFGRESVLETFARAGVEAERIRFGGHAPRRGYLERYNEVDLALDTYPFGGGTTTLDAVFMGVPVVTLSGPMTMQRAGSSIAMNLGLPELIATSEDEFVARALALATDLPRLATLRAGLRSRLAASPVGDAPRFARRLEGAYRTAWRRYCTGAE